MREGGLSAAESETMFFLFAVVKRTPEDVYNSKD